MVIPTTHHLACDCREAKVRELVEAVRAFARVVHYENLDLSVQAWRGVEAALRHFLPDKEKP